MQSFAEKIRMETSAGLIYGLRSKIGTKMYFFILLVDKYKEALLLRKLKQKDEMLNLTEYGTILAKGDGEKPSDSVCKRMKSEYGVDLEKNWC